MRNFRELKVWNDAMDLVPLVYDLTKGFPKDEKYGLASQVNRSAVSIPSNIAEGCSRSSDNDMCRFLEIAAGSAFELSTQIEIAKNLNYISNANFDEVFPRITILCRSLNKFRNYLKNLPST